MTREGVDAPPGAAVTPMTAPPRARAIPVSTVAAIAAGGVIGAEARYGVSRLLPHPATGFPWSTLVVNLSGCLVMGVLMVIPGDLIAAHRLWRAFLGVGVLGGYTTFSTYSVDAQRLLVTGRPGVAVTYLALTTATALPAVWVGVVSTRAVVRTVSDRAGHLQHEGSRT